jgi:hypothetical protein
MVESGRPFECGSVIPPMATLQDEQSPFDRAICDAMVASTPEDWNVIVLELERPEGKTGLGDFLHSLRSPEGRPAVMPDDSIYDATFRLDELLRRYGGFLRRATYTVTLSSDSWSYKADFEYGQPAAG